MVARRRFPWRPFRSINGSTMTPAVVHQIQISPRKSSGNLPSHTWTHFVDVGEGVRLFRWGYRVIGLIDRGVRDRRVVGDTHQARPYAYVCSHVGSVSATQKPQTNFVCFPPW